MRLLSRIFGAPARILRSLHHALNHWRIERTLDRLAEPRWCYNCGSRLGETSYYRSVAVGWLHLTIRDVRSLCQTCAHEELENEPQG